MVELAFQTSWFIPMINHWGKCKKMAPKCDMVVKKLISSGFIYFYLTQNISALAV